MKKYSIYARLLVLVLCACIALVGCTSPTTDDKTGTPTPGTQPSSPPSGGSGAATGEPIKVGLLQPITGPIAATGIAIRDAAILYQDYINANGGVNGRPIQLVIEDTGNDPTMSASAMNKVVTQDKVPVVIGAWGSSPTLAAVAVAKEHNVPMVVETASSFKVTDKNEEGSPWIFRLSAPTAMEIAVMRDILKDELNFLKPYVIAVNNDWGRGSVDEFNKLYTNVYGLALAGSDFVEATETDYSAVLTKVLASGADSVIAVGDAAQIALEVEQARNLGLDLPFLGTGMACSIYKISSLVGMTAAEGFCQTVGFMGNIDPAMTVNPEMAQLFVDLWNSKGYEIVEMQEAARGFDALYVVCEALKTIDGEITREAVRDALAALETNTHSYGKVKFTEWGNFINQNISQVSVIGIKDGKDVVILPPTYPVYQD